MTLHDISLSIREVGHIWLIEFPAYGTVFRVDIGQRQARVVVPKPGQIAPIDIPVEKTSVLHVVDSMTIFRAWLQTLSL